MNLQCSGEHSSLTMHSQQTRNAVIEKGQDAIGACCNGTESEFRDSRSFPRRGNILPEPYGGPGDGQLSWG